jgi:hypothetical protein
MLKQHAIRIGSLLLLAATILGGLSAHTEILFADGLFYVRQAQAMDHGSWADGLVKAIDHPAFPLEIVAAHRLIGGDGPESWQGAVVPGVIATSFGPLWATHRRLPSSVARTRAIP